MTAEGSERDDAYRAIGRYFVEFSRMTFHMRNAVVLTLGWDHQVGDLVLGEVNAQPLTDAFFAICRHVVGGFKADEEKIALELRNAVLTEVKRRNDFAHGDWWVGFSTDPKLWRTKPARKQGAFSSTDFPISELDQITDKLYTLRQYVAEFGDICLKRHLQIQRGRDLRVTDVFAMSGKEVTRTGPQSAEIRPTRYS